LNFGLFLCVAGIIMLLRDLVAHGDARISLTPADPMMRSHEEVEDPRERRGRDGGTPDAGPDKIPQETTSAEAGAPTVDRDRG